MATLAGMAIGGWMPDGFSTWTGSYRAAFVNGNRLEPGDDRASRSSPLSRAALVPRET